MQVRSYLGIVILITLIFGTAVVAGLTLTTPVKLGPPGVTLWFVALLTALSGLFCLMLYALKVRRRPADSRRSQLGAAWRQGALIGSGLVIVLALASLRQLDFRDVVLIAILLALIEVYFRTRR